MFYDQSILHRLFHWKSFAVTHRSAKSAKLFHLKRFAIIIRYLYFIMSYVRLSSCIHGFHKYQAIWEPTHGEELDCCREIGNTSDPYAVSVMKGREVVGHVPCKISRMCAVFMRNGGSIKCTVMVNRRYSCDLPQGGMEIPCLLRFFGEDKWLKKYLS